MVDKWSDCSGVEKVGDVLMVLIVGVNMVYKWFDSVVLDYLL